ncbi:hypothetical protein [Sphingomonas yunnanensis]|uniref:hypothetical protein n=1 Tax=Sphingomonas yunnanensis TaxID=310400 RepID=UPI001FE2AEF2|nr:hypothetical protein [Sphingomonas yunnanensis]
MAPIRSSGMKATIAAVIRQRVGGVRQHHARRTQHVAGQMKLLDQPRAVGQDDRGRHPAAHVEIEAGHDVAL